MGLILWWVNLRSSHSLFFFFSVKTWCCTSAVAEQSPVPVLSAGPHWRCDSHCSLDLWPTLHHHTTICTDRWWTGSWTNVAKTTKLPKKAKNQLAQSDSLHCHANLGKESAITLSSSCPYISYSKAAMGLCQSGSRPGGWEGKPLLTVWARDQGSLFHKFTCLKVESGRCQETLNLHRKKAFAWQSSKNLFQDNTVKIPFFCFHLRVFSSPY